MSEQFNTVFGPVPHDWDVKTIGELAIHIGSGITPTGGSDVYTTSGVTFIRSQNVTNDGLLLDDVAFIDKKMHDRMKGSEVFAFDVLLNITGASIGRCCYLPLGHGSVNVNQHVCAIRLPSANESDAKYLASVLASPIGQNQIFRLNAGGNREGLNYQQLRVFRIPWPPREGRAGIARILTTVDNLIEKTEALIAKYQAIKQGMMHDLFTRGVDSRGHLRPPYEQAPELYKQSELGWIPKEWEVRLMNDLVSPTRPIAYGILMPGYGHPGGVPVIKVKDICQGGIDESDLLLTTPEIDRQYRRSRVATGDLLFTIRGTVGRTAFVPESLSKANITQDTARIGIVSGDARFVRGYLDMPVPKRFIVCNTLGVAVQGINLGEVRRIPIAFPPITEQRKIGDIWDGIEAEVDCERLSLNKLKTVKMGLMNDLLIGKVRVKVDEDKENTTDV